MVASTRRSWLRRVLLVFSSFHLCALSEGTTRLVPTEYPTIQDAIDHSSEGDTVLLCPGVHRGVGNRDIELRGLDLIVTSQEGPEETILDCEQAGRGFYLHEGETRAARIEGITISNGAALTGFEVRGGGILCELSSPTIVNCRIVDCGALQLGGGAYLLGFNGRIEQCLIQNNAVYQGDGGGGIAFPFGSGEIVNTVITGNWGYYGGGVNFGGTAANRLIGCSIVGNGATHGGGVYSANPVHLERCIVWGNASVLSADQMYCYSADFRCCAVDTSDSYYMHGVQYDGDCVFTDPLFCDPAHGDWSLDAASLCLPEHSPCGELIGALGQGCGIPAPMGACCLEGGVCAITTCQACETQQGSYLGDGTDCEPNPCPSSPALETTWGAIKALFRWDAR